MMIQKRTSFAFVAVAALLLSACANQMEPAQRAIANIEAAIAAAPDAPKYIPDQVAAVQAKLADLKAAYDKQDYKTVLAQAPAVLADAQGLLGAAMLKKESVVKAMSAEWPTLSAAMPALMTAVTKRVNALGKSKHAPAGVDMAAAKSAADEAAASWTKAQAANSAGDMEGAVNSAHDAKAKLEAAAAAMKMTLPATPAAK
jgi:subtilase-type serine protease